MYSSLAKALNTYSDQKGTTLNACGEDDIDTINDLIDRGYRYLAASPTFSGPSYDEVNSEGGQVSSLIQFNPLKIEWDNIKSEVPTLVEKDADCDTAITEKEYGFKVESDSYFHADKINWLGGSFGKGVYFDGITINSQDTKEGEFYVYTSSDLELYALNTASGIVVNDSAGRTLVSFVSGHIYAQVDVRVKGDSRCAKIEGVYDSGVFDNGFPGYIHENYPPAMGGGGC